MMGGKEVPGTTTDARQKRLLNVVEEMALAAGVPVPPVYVLEEPGINAFAAGYAPGDAVVAVSQGCLNYLTRDELQGVVAHEFSHILNGDMRLNIRLIGVIFGIMAVSIIGRILMLTSRGRSSGKGWRRGVAGPGHVCAGPGGSVLRSADHGGGISAARVPGRRQRHPVHAQPRRHWRGAQEDRWAGRGVAHRQPPGRRGRSHVFRQRLRRRRTGRTAGHPPSPRRAHPPARSQFDGQFPEVRPVGVDREELEGPRRSPTFAGIPRLPGLPQVPLPVLGFADEAASRVGHVDPEVISCAQALHDGMPDVLRVAAQEPFSAHALVYALLLDPRADLRELQLTRLKASAEPQEFAETLRLDVAVQALPDTHRLPLLDLTMPALRQMSPRQHRAFRAQVEVLMIADERLSLFEYTLRCVLHRHLDAQFLPPRQTRPMHSSPQKLAHPVATVLALLAWEGEPEPNQAARAFDFGHARLHRRRPHPPLATPRKMLPRRVRRGAADAPSIRSGHQAPDRRSLHGLHPGEPARHRPRSRAAPRHLRYARLPATAACRGGSGRTMNDRMSSVDGPRDARRKLTLWRWSGAVFCPACLMQSIETAGPDDHEQGPVLLLRL